MSQQSNVELLVPALRERLGSVLAALTARGFEYIVWETRRSKERAKKLSDRGVGIEDSMHCYDVACDVLCKKHMWDCARHGCRFYENFGELCEDQGLTWGGRFKRVDKPHVQAVPATPKHQNAIRRMKPELIDTYVRAVLAGEVR
jgi:hypothetical protein